MFALDIGIRHWVALSPEYHDFCCLAGQDIRLRYSCSISRRWAEQQNKEPANV
jgi:hypothetical protein